MKDRFPLLLGKALLVLAGVLVAWNLRSEAPSSGNEARAIVTHPTRAKTESRGAAPEPRRELVSTDGPVAEWRRRLAEHPHPVVPENREAILELAEELQTAIRHGVDPRGEDARVYNESMKVLLLEQPAAQ